MSTTKNIGQVAGLFIGTSAPQNTTLIWFDSTTNQRCHKVFDPKTGLWKVLEPGIVALTTYSELVNNAKKNGLSIGKFYQITDKSNVLAITIGTTKVQYVDSLGNILIDDLGTNIQYHVSSGNLLIDDVIGVFDTDTNKLVFSFKEQDPSSDDYVLGKKRNGTKWDLFKFKISSLISKNANNSITWNKGFFFNFTQSIKSLLNKTGGIVGYDEYSQKTQQIDKQLKEVSKENQTIIQDADKKVTEKTEATAIFDKKIPKNIDVTVAPGDVLLNDTLFNIVSKFQRWINQFKYATGVRLSASFKDAKSMQYINNNDTVESAFGKIQYMLKNLTTSGQLPKDWSTVGLDEDGKPVHSTTAFTKDGFPVAGDSIFYAFAKIVDFITYCAYNSKIQKWDSLDTKPNGGFILDLNDTISTALKKLFENSRNINNGQLGRRCVDYDNIKNVGVLSTDVVRFELNTTDIKFFGAGCGIGGVISKDNSGFQDLGYIFTEDYNYPTDPYRIVPRSVSWGDEENWPQILSFIPVIYFPESNSQMHYTNASSFVHVKEKIYLQFIIYLNNTTLSAIRDAGKTSLSIEIQVDAYGYKSGKVITSKSLGNVIILNMSIGKAIMEKGFENNQHIVFYAKIS